MSQGFLAPSNEGRWNEVEDIGICYYRDLITRNLIKQDGSMHDVIRSFACYMAKEEALIIEPDQVSSLVSSPKIRRLSIEPAVSGLEPVVLPDWSSISEKQEFLTSLIICSRMKFDPSTSDFVLNRFVSLRALFLFAAESDMFSRSLGILKHLRFLLLWRMDICQLPDDIGKMRFLEHIHMQECGSFAGKIPSSMLKLERLRYLSIVLGTKFTVPKGIGGLTNLRTLQVLPVQIDGNGMWCSLQELEPLSRLRKLKLENLEAVPSGSLAAKAKIRDKEELRDLFYACYKGLEVPSIAFDEVAAEDCQRVEEVFDQLCPPPQLEQLDIRNYIGRQPPSWMRMKNTGVEVYFNSLTSLQMLRLPLCTQLPDSLCRLPSLVSLQIKIAPAIRRVGPEFQAPDRSSSLARRMSSFPKLQLLRFHELPQWEEWVWDDDEEATKAEDGIAMPSLRTIHIEDCKLCRLPTGLASSSRIALKEVFLSDAARITALDNFPSVVKLDVRRCASLKIIRGVPSMRTVYIAACPALEVLEGGQALHTVELADSSMETLPEYLRGLKPRILRLNACHQKLGDLLSLSSSSDMSSAHYKSEMDKVKHCGKLVVL